MKNYLGKLSDSRWKGRVNKLMLFDLLNSKYKYILILSWSIFLVLLSRSLILIVYYIYENKMNYEGSFISSMNHYDAAWYRSIVWDGYALEPQMHPNGDAANWAFFPLVPLVVGGIYKVTGADVMTIGTIVNTLILIGTVYISFFYMVDTRKSIKSALIMNIVLTFGMYSFFFSTLYTESLFSFLLILSLYLLNKKKYILMGVSGALLSATRNTGILLVFAVAVYVIIDYFKSKNHKSLKDFFYFIFGDSKLIFGTTLIPLGMFSYMIFLWNRMGDPFAFVHIQKAWQAVSDGNPIFILYSGLTSGNIQQIYLSMWAVLGFFCIIYLLVKKRYHEAILAFIFLIIPLSIKLQSIPRYIFGSIVFILAFSEWLSVRKSKILIGFVLVLISIIELICVWYWMGDAPLLV